MCLENKWSGKFCAVSEENWKQVSVGNKSQRRTGNIFRASLRVHTSGRIHKKIVFSLYFTSPTIFRNIPPSTRNILIKSCILFESLPIVFVLKLCSQTAARRLKKKVQAFLNTDSSFVYTSNLKLETITRQDSTITTTPIGHGMEFADKNKKN